LKFGKSKRALLLLFLGLEDWLDLNRLYNRNLLWGWNDNRLKRLNDGWFNGLIYDLLGWLGNRINLSGVIEFARSIFISAI
jgi:hypothetical protein